MFATSNPALRQGTFDNYYSGSIAEPMTIQGTINKTFVLLFLVVAAAMYVWVNPLKYAPLMLPAAIASVVVAIVIAFKRQWVAFLAPVYALMQGAFLGVLSSMLEKSMPGVVMKAVGLTFGVLFVLLALYRSGAIRPSEKFKMGVAAATGGLFLLYMADMVLGFFGHGLGFMSGGGIIGIGFSVFVCGLAAMNLILDFDIIEQGSRSGAPKYMEWYGAFALMVTLVWLYIEIIRLLSKLNRRND